MLEVAGQLDARISVLDEEFDEGRIAQEAAAAAEQVGAGSVPACGPSRGACLLGGHLGRHMCLLPPVYCIGCSPSGTCSAVPLVLVVPQPPGTLYCIAISTCAGPSGVVRTSSGIIVCLHVVSCASIFHFYQLSCDVYMSPLMPQVEHVPA